jgi:hypothetical protein
MALLAPCSYCCTSMRDKSCSKRQHRTCNPICRCWYNHDSIRKCKFVTIHEGTSAQQAWVTAIIVALKSPFERTRWVPCERHYMSESKFFRYLSARSARRGSRDMCLPRVPDVSEDQSQNWNASRLGDSDTSRLVFLLLRNNSHQYSRYGLFSY